MIQRIQTIYLFVAAIMMGLMFLFPLSEILMPDNSIFIVDFYEISQEKTNTEAVNAEVLLPLSVLLSVITLSIFLNIFFFRSRKIQMKVCIYNIVMMLGLIFLVYYYTEQVAEIHKPATVNYTFPMIFPIISSVLTFLAYKGIRNDEQVVRSLDRIR